MSLPNSNTSKTQNNLLGDTILLNRTSIQYFMNQHNLYINHRGYINNNKMTTNIRILLLNSHGCRPFNNEKINMLIQSCQKYQIDMCITIRKNVRTNSSR